MTAGRDTISPAGTGARQADAAEIRRHARSYLLIRLTGLLLAVLVCGHFVVMHFANDVSATNASFIAKRWSQGLWVAWDWLMLATGLLHGAIGINTGLRDYASGRRRRALRTGLIALTTALFAFGSIVIARGAGT